MKQLLWNKIRRKEWKRREKCKENQCKNSVMKNTNRNLENHVHLGFGEDFRIHSALWLKFNFPIPSYVTFQFSSCNKRCFLRALKLLQAVGAKPSWRRNSIFTFRTRFSPPHIADRLSEGLGDELMIPPSETVLGFSVVLSNFQRRGHQTEERVRRAAVLDFPTLPHRFHRDYQPPVHRCCASH